MKKKKKKLDQKASGSDWSLSEFSNNGTESLAITLSSALSKVLFLPHPTLQCSERELVKKLDVDFIGYCSSKFYSCLVLGEENLGNIARNNVLFIVLAQ